MGTWQHNWNAAKGAAWLQKQVLLSAHERAAGLEAALQTSQTASAKAAKVHAAQQEALAG